MLVKEYGVVKNLSLISLISEIDYLIEKGWQPLGGIAVAYGVYSPAGEPALAGISGILYVQAIVKG